jgi:hypothetical protein
MTLKLTEGFDWLETADLPNAFSAFGNVQPVGTMTQTIQEGGGRNGDKCIRIVPAQTGNYYYPNNIQGKSFASGITGGNTIICGFAVKFNTFHDSGNLVFAAIKSNAGVDDGLYNILLAVTSAKLLTIGHTASSGTSFTNTNFSGSSTTVFVTGVWYHIAIKFLSHASAGTIEVQINGVTEIGPLTGKDTLVSDNGVSALILGSIVPNSTIPSIDFDDVYIADTAGSFNNDFLGDVQVKMLKPNGNGNSSQFTGSDADSTDNYLLVDDGAAPDEDTTYVEDGVTGEKDTYTYENTPSGITSIKAVNVKTLGKKTTGGANDLKAVARSSGTETDSANIGLTTSYTMQPAIYEVDPNTSAAWGVSAFNSAEFGYKVA